MAKTLPSSQRGADQARGSIFWGLRLACIAIMAVFLSAAGCEEEAISPPGGDYPGSIVVSFNFPGADEIWYTLDGSEPTSKCLQYQEGDLVVIDSSTVVKARSVTYGAETVYSDVASATYQMAGDGSGTDDSVNGLAVNAWYAYDAETRRRFEAKYFGGDGCQPVLRCGGELNLGDLGQDYYICDADDSITDPAACTSAGGGWVLWRPVQEGFGAINTFIYNNYTVNFASGETVAATGSIVGHFDSNGTGTTSTSEGETIRMTGTYEAEIEDAVSITETAKTGGSYFVTCSAPGCVETGLTYLVMGGGELKLLPATAASCEAGPAFISIRQEGVCLAPSVEKGDFAELVSCNSELADQQWDIIENSDSAEPEDFIIQLKDGSECLSALPHFGGPRFYNVAACVGNDPSQVFTFAKADGDTSQNARIVAHADAFTDSATPLCLAPLSPFAKLINAVDCADEAQFVDFEFLIGNTFPVQQLDPTTDLLEPLEPVTFDFTGRADQAHQDSVVIQSPLHDNLSVTVTSENKARDAKKVGALNLEGFGVFTSGINLEGIQKDERLVLTFDQPVDVSNVTLRQWEELDQIKLIYGADEMVITQESDALNSEESVPVDLKGITSLVVKGDSWLTVVFLKSITVTPTVR